MDSVDRATLIDFALGRLNDAETSALARRAEEDSEFAQTLDALRRELATLDAVRPTAPSFFSRRAPQLLPGPSVSPSLDVEPENRAPFPPDAPQNDVSPSAADAEPQDERLVFLNATPSNAVKVRRIGPVYPYYSDDEEPVAESCALQAVFSSTCAQDGQNGEEAQESENKQNNQETQNGEEAQESENKQNNQEAQIDEEAQESENEQNNQETQNDEEAQESENEQNNQEAQNSEEAQESENEQNSENAPFEQATPTRASRRFHFIPKFIATSRDAQRSPFVAKRARRLDPDVSAFASPLVQSQDAVGERDESLVYRDPPQSNAGEPNVFAAPPIDAILETPDLTPRLDDEARQETGAENADKETGAAVPQLDVETPDLTPDLTPRLDDEARRETSPQNAETLLADEEQAPNVALESHPVADETFESALAPAERRLAELLGRRPSKIELDEYYWEPIVETSQVEYESKKRASLLETAGRWATAPAIAVGRATLALCGFDRRSALGFGAFAATKPRRRRQPSKISDMMISTVSGVLIAVVVVFPLMRLAVKEVFTTIAKSAVRKIGVNVAISENAPQSDLLPFISEQLVFPRYDESAELQAPVDATHREPETRSQTLAPVDDVFDPASTPPTLESAPVDANAPVVLPQNAPN